MAPLESFSPARVVESLEEMTFRTLADFGDGAIGVFWSEAGGPSPWEMHPECDELLHVLEGEIEVEVLPHQGGPAERARVATGEMIVIPRGHWHRQDVLVRTHELYLTPGPTEHSTAEDPREEAAP